MLGQQRKSSENYLQNCEVGYPDCSPSHTINLPGWSQHQAEDENEDGIFQAKHCGVGLQNFKGDIWDKLLNGDTEMKHNIELPRMYLDYSRPKRREPLECWKPTACMIFVYVSHSSVEGKKSRILRACVSAWQGDMLPGPRQHFSEYSPLTGNKSLLFLRSWICLELIMQEKCQRWFGNMTGSAF